MFNWAISLFSGVNTEICFRSQFRLFFSYKSPTFGAAVRSENFGMSDFVAGCGGLLGLFMGISVLSILEIIYFFTIHLVLNVERK